MSEGPLDLTAVAADDARVEAARARLGTGAAGLPTGDPALDLLAALADEVSTDARTALLRAVPAPRGARVRRTAGRGATVAVGLAVLCAGGAAAAASSPGSPLRPVRDVVTGAVQHAVDAVRPGPSASEAVQGRRTSPSARPRASSPATPRPSGTTLPPRTGPSPVVPGTPTRPPTTPGSSPAASPAASPQASPAQPAPTGDPAASRAAATRVGAALDRAAADLDAGRLPAALAALQAAARVLPDVQPQDGRADLTARLRALRTRYAAAATPAPVQPVLPVPSPGASGVPLPLPVPRPVPLPSPVVLPTDLPVLPSLLPAPPVASASDRAGGHGRPTAPPGRSRTAPPHR